MTGFRSLARPRSQLAVGWHGGAFGRPRYRHRAAIMADGAGGWDRPRLTVAVEGGCGEVAVFLSKARSLRDDPA